MTSHLFPFPVTFGLWPGQFTQRTTLMCLLPWRTYWRPTSSHPNSSSSFQGVHIQLYLPHSSSHPQIQSRKMVWLTPTPISLSSLKDYFKGFLLTGSTLPPDSEKPTLKTRELVDSTVVRWPGLAAYVHSCQEYFSLFLLTTSTSPWLSFLLLSPRHWMLIITPQRSLLTSDLPGLLPVGCRVPLSIASRSPPGLLLDPWVVAQYASSQQSNIWCHTPTTSDMTLISCSRAGLHLSPLILIPELQSGPCCKQTNSISSLRSSHSN